MLAGRRGLDAAHARPRAPRREAGQRAARRGEHVYLTDFGITKRSAALDRHGAGRRDAQLLAPEQTAARRSTPHRRLRARLRALRVARRPAALPREPMGKPSRRTCGRCRRRCAATPQFDPVLRKGPGQGPRGERYGTVAELIESGRRGAQHRAAGTARETAPRSGGGCCSPAALLLVAAAAAVVVLELTGDGEHGARRARPGRSRLGRRTGPGFEPDRRPGAHPRPAGAACRGTADRSGSPATPAGRSPRSTGARSRWTGSSPANAAVTDIAATDDSVWFARRAAKRAPSGSMPPTGPSAEPACAHRPACRPTRAGVDVGRGAVWVTDGTTRLLKLDPRGRQRPQDHRRGAAARRRGGRRRSGLGDQRRVRARVRDRSEERIDPSNHPDRRAGPA